MMKQVAYFCDRCDAKANSKSGGYYERVPAGWVSMTFDQNDYYLCPTCAEDVRLALQNLMKVTS